MQLIFSKLFKPKWQHNNAAVRKQAISQLAQDNLEHQSILYTLARRDEDPEVRCAAIERLTELSRLHELLDATDTPELRHAVLRRSCHLLTNSHRENAPTPDASAQLKLIERIDEPELLTHLALNATDSEIGIAAIVRIRDSLCLEQIAVNAQASPLRQAAASRVEAPASLERLQRDAKQRDKGVLRIVRAKLKAIREREAETRRLCDQADELCEALGNLARCALFPLYEAKLNALTQQWSQLPENIRSPRQSTYDDATERCREKLQAAVAEQAAAEALAQQAAKAKTEQQSWLQEQESRLKSHYERLSTDAPLPPLEIETPEQAWKTLTAEVSAEAGEERRFQAIQADYQTLLAGWERLQQLRSELESLLETTEEATLETQRNSLQDLQRKLDWPTQLPRPPLVAKLEARCQALQQQWQQQRDEQRQATRAIGQQLETLAKHLRAGEARPALNLHKQMLALFNDTSATENGVTDALAQQFKSLHAQIQELKSWQQYAIVPKKEELCESMEQLADTTMTVELRAQRIKALQQTWKELDSQDSEHDQGLWHRFKQASDQAYAPCKAHFAEQRQLRIENLHKREELCTQLQTFIDNVDWEQPDWKLIEKLLHTAKQEWRSYSPVDRKPGQPLQDRFNGQLAHLEERLDQERKRNGEAKQALIARAEELHQLDDLKAATDEAKQLQQQWKTLGATHRKQERELWNSFRNVCNQLFEKRQQQWQQRQCANQLAIAEARQLCDEVKALSPEAGQLKKTLEELKARFASISLANRDAKVWRGHFESACQALESQCQVPLIDQATEQALLERRRLCREIEALALGEVDPSRADALKSTWQQAQPVSSPYLERLEARYQAALSLLSSEDPDALIAESEKQLRLLCVQLEILSGRPSPETDQLLRMEYQMSRLKEALEQHENSQDPEQREAEKLELLWRCSALENRFPELETRFFDVFGAITRAPAN